MEADIIMLLGEYRTDYTVPLYGRHSRKHIEERSAYRWAVDELEIYILSHLEVEFIDACMMFIRQMSYYRRRYPGARAMCDAAIEVASDITDILMCMKEEGDCNE